MSHESKPRRLAYGLAALVAVAAAGCGGGGVPDDAIDEVHGAGTLAYVDPVTTLTAYVTIDAQQYDSVSNTAFGSFFLQQTDWYKGKVTSLVVVGDSAVAGGVIVDSSDDTILDRGFYEVVVDVDSSGTADRSQTLFLPPGDPPPWVGEIPTPIFVMTAGDYVVINR